MIQSKELFEWSTDVALSIAQKYCAWIVPEDADEDNCDSVLEPKSESILREVKKSKLLAEWQTPASGVGSFAQNEFNSYAQKQDELPEIQIEVDSEDQ